VYPLKPGTGDLNADRRKENSPLQCDILIINPPLKGLKEYIATVKRIDLVNEMEGKRFS
jgi:hypothetical protein